MRTLPGNLTSPRAGPILTRGAGCATNIFDVPGISAITNPLEALVAACVHAAGVPRE